MDLSSQQIGSMEFKIEVASACAESGMNYKVFAKLYNLNADELNAWAVEFLGEGFE
jgi:transposase-like protein